MDPIDVCYICDRPLENEEKTVTIVRAKGLTSLTKKSKEKMDNKWEKWAGYESFPFHLSCRKRYGVSSNRKTVHSTVTPSMSAHVPTPSTSLDEAKSTNTNYSFDYSSLCLFCAKPWQCSRKIGSRVQYDYIKERWIGVAERKGDQNSIDILYRLRGVPSLVEAQARYHRKCLIYFIREKPIKPTITVHADERKSFESLCEYMESSNKFVFHLSDLIKIVGGQHYTNKTLYQKLKEKYAGEILIVNQPGREGTIFFKSQSFSNISRDWFSNKESVGELQKELILSTAADIIKTDIINTTLKTETYPAPAKFLNSVVNDIPNSLKHFLDALLFKYTEENEERQYLKRDSIAHAIISVLRPKSFTSCLQLAVGTYVYRKTGSRLILDLLSKLGFCSSYRSTQLYEASAIMDPPKTNTENVFVQYIFDNTDNNVGTLRGHENFHCLGGIAVFTPEDGVFCEGTSKKCKSMPSAEKLASLSKIQSISYNTNDTCERNGFQTIEYVDTSTLDLKKSPRLPPSYSTYLWAKFYNISHIPSWKGFMEKFSSDTTFSMSHIQCLPFINEPCSKLSTLYTALHHARVESDKLKQETCFVTFDQPLYIKARGLVSQFQDQQLKNVVVRLGGFHMLISYLGAIGYVMDGSGLDDLWSVAYAPESVKKMLTGHAFARSVRAHIITLTALGRVICQHISHSENYKNLLEQFMEKMKQSTVTIENCNAKTFIKEMTKKFTEQMSALKNNGPTAALWIQYFECVVVALQFIEAERSGNWELHLASVKKMLPLFYASGQIHYAKSAQIYLQDMVNLQYTMDHEEFDQFTNDGFFTIRRSEKAWSGVWSDITIEQTLNRFFGTDLKHGRGVTPSVISRYLLGMPSAFSIMECLENYCSLKSETSEQYAPLQHDDRSKGRMKHDNEDLEKFMFWLQEHQPFENRTSLVSLSTGIIGGPNIDCHLAIEKGLQGMATMVGKNAQNIVYHNIFKVNTLATAQFGVHIDDEQFVAVNSSLLFQRISILFSGDKQKTREVFQYELSPFPLSLFDDDGFMRKSQKSELYKIFDSSITSEISLKESVVVIDGGFLLHHVDWPHNQTYKDIFNVYHTYIIQNYSSDAWVVFDGYSRENIGVKSYERYRRREKIMAADVVIEENKIVPIDQAKFLSNVANKRKFIDLLSTHLGSCGIKVKNAEEDADLLIVKTAIEIRQITTKSVVIVGNDIDLLVLLTGLASELDIIYFYKDSHVKKNIALFSTRRNKNLRPFILFAHAFAGCDTTSALYNKGKKKIINLITKYNHLQKMVDVFYSKDSSIDALKLAGEIFIKELYGSDTRTNTNISISEIRYQNYVTALGQVKKEVCLAVLPPTEPALIEHIKRVYFQIQQWLDNPLNPIEWGWRRTTSLMLPIMNQQHPAPSELLQQIFCSCKCGCSITKCGCRKVGIRCTVLCKGCHGECPNASQEKTPVQLEENDDDVEEYEGDFETLDCSSNIECFRDDNIDVDCN